MKKLIQGIVEFRLKRLPQYRETFAVLALGQKPDALFITCSDSRVAANVFASTDPGDLFVVRNVGNLVAPCSSEGHADGDESEFAAIEFALMNLNVQSIVICGHSECGAMQAICGGRDKVTAPHLRSWLRHGMPAYERLDHASHIDPAMPAHNRLSQLNVIQQLDHLRTYPLVRERIAADRLGLYGLWFDIKNAEVSWYESSLGKFRPIDEEAAAKIVRSLDR